MNETFISVVLFGWIPVVLVMFVAMPPRRAVVAAYVAAAMFLPVYRFKTTGNYGKETATSIILLAAVAILDPTRLARFRPSLADLPMIVFLLVPLASSINNGSGAYDGASAMLRQILFWGTPYLMGRLYLTDPPAHREMALALAAGALIYVPLCLYEMKMSPQLHLMLYGYHPHEFVQSIRMEGYRPVVFMDHGLSVALWMVCGSLAALWLWYSGATKRIVFVPIELAAPVILITTVLCRSMGAVMTLVAALAALFAAKALQTRLPLMLLAIVPLVYITDRVAGTGIMEQAYELTKSVSAERASSMKVRLDNERLLVDKALRQPLVGWGNSGEYRVKDEEGNDISVTDGMWAIILGSSGLTGMIAFLGFRIAPSVSVLRKVRASALASADAAGPVVLAMVGLMVMIDSLPNSPMNPVYSLVAGGLVSLSVTLRRGRGVAPPAQPVRPAPEELFGHEHSVQ